MDYIIHHTSICQLSLGSLEFKLVWIFGVEACITNGEHYEEYLDYNTSWINISHIDCRVALAR